jgi:hypothetical protein
MRHVFDNRLGAQYMLIETVVLVLGLVIIPAVTNPAKNDETSLAGTTAL